MFIDLTDEQRALRDELRAYFAGVLSDDERAAISTDPFGEMYETVVRRLGSDGWLGLGWPKEFGGRGLGPVEQQIFVNEVTRARVPYPLITLQTVGPTLQRYGTQEQKDFFLPKILAGEIHFAIGYSEPGAGTDLAALRTTAVRDGDSYVINGQKIYTSGAHRSDYVWMACRTDPDAKPHKGITILIVDCRDPGFSWTPIITADGQHHTNSTYYDDVRVPVSMRVGEENDGWNLIINQLNHERLTLAPAGNVAGAFDAFLGWARRTPGPGGSPLAEEPAVRRAIGRIYAYLRLNELLNWQVAASIDTGWLGAPDSSAMKIYASERLQEVHRIIGDVVGRYGDPGDPETATLIRAADRGAKGALVMTFGGGVNEVQRELIATLALNLPRAPR